MIALYVAIIMRTEPMAPKRLAGLKKVQVVAGEKVELSCRINRGCPAAEVHWYRSGKICKMFSEIDNSDKYEMTSDADRRSLIIAVSEVTDSATYRCEAVNKYGKVRTECRLVVLRMFVSLLALVFSIFTGVVCSPFVCLCVRMITCEPLEISSRNFQCIT